MKRIFLSLLLAFITVTAFSQSGEIIVTVVSSEPVTGLTSIDYEFTGIATRTYDLSVDVKFDEAGYVPIPNDDLSGAISNVSGVETTFSGTIVWDGAASFPDHHHEQTRIKIMATPYVFQCGDNVTFTYRGSEVTYGTVVVDYGGSIGEKCWMDRNLGATRVAIASDDDQAYGDLFQWGRLDDGHQVVNWTSSTTGDVTPTTTTLSDDDVPGHGEFITNYNYPFDWRSDKNDNLWQGGAEDNNPCPPGWHVPTHDEWAAELDSWGSDNNSTGAINSPLKLSAAGRREPTLIVMLFLGSYWSSTATADGVFLWNLGFFIAGAEMYSEARFVGSSVRCIKD